MRSWISIKKILLFICCSIGCTAGVQAQDDDGTGSQLQSSFSAVQAESFLKSNDFENALNYATKSVKANPKNHIGWHVFGKVNYYYAMVKKNELPVTERSKRFTEAIDAFTKSIELFNSASTPYQDLSILNDTYIMRGECRQELGDQEGAVEDFAESVKIKPTVFLFVKIGQMKYDAGDYAGSIQAYDQLDSLVDPNDKKEKFWGEFHYLRGNAKIQNNQYAEAIADLDKGIELNPEEANLWAERGYAKFRLNRGNEALIDFDKAVELDPENHDFRNKRGLTRGLLGDSRGAIEDYTEAIRIAPNCATAWNNRGWRKLLLGMDDEARIDFKKAQELKPSDQLSKNNYDYLKKRLKSRYASTHLITVGVNNYQDFKLSPLEYPIDASFAIQNTFLRRNILKNSASLFDDRATRTQIIQTLQAVSSGSEVAANDILIFYFSGYGSFIGNQIQLYSYDYSGMPSDLIGESTIRDILNKSAAKFKIAIFDLYPTEQATSNSEILEDHSAATKRDTNTVNIDVEKMIEWYNSRNLLKEGTAIILNINKYPNVAMQGLLTKSIIFALNHGQADNNGDKFISFKEFTNYINRSFSEKTIPVPKILSTLDENTTIFIYSN